MTEEKIDPHLNLIMNFGKIKIYMVDGSLVRNKIYIDFVMGGHDLIYPFIPRNEIWIDDNFKDDIPETEAIILHELIERRLMEKGMKYSDAHALASVVEVKWREKNFNNVNGMPSAEIVPIDQLKVDGGNGENLNRMTQQQLEALKKSIQRWGSIVPIITNKDIAAQFKR